jgi:hypothetical protein
MKNWMSAGRKFYDPFHVLAGFFVGIAISAGVVRDFPRAAGWLTICGMAFATILLALAQARSTTRIQEIAQLPPN